MRVAVERVHAHVPLFQSVIGFGMDQSGNRKAVHILNHVMALMNLERKDRRAVNALALHSKPAHRWDRLGLDTASIKPTK